MMKTRTYHIIRKVHLYASLPIVALLLMYIVSSYFMIHYDLFNTYEREEMITRVELASDMNSEAQWDQFLAENGVSGKLTDETALPDGVLLRKYERAGKSFEVRLYAGEKTAEIKKNNGNLPAVLVGFHRIRGFEGPWPYLIYAVLLDIVGISLILFAITGAILWLKLLKNSLTAWIIFLAGFIYVAAIITYLSVV
ncbi:MAG: hypothetical protein DHS20C17_03230 [Cyclobacteriaceae bacterium]|nr:MAG: hypothetical protein DHS20C17_03230 [Cyclobacteriaceae bacterium]